MMPTTRDAKSESRLSETIRRGIRTDLNRRSLSRIAAFRTDETVPDQLQQLLGELERAERAQN